VQQTAVPFSAFLQDYKTLNLPPPATFVQIENAKLVLQNFLSARNQLVQKLNDIEYIQFHPDQFVNPEQFDLAGMHAKVAEALNQITRNASECVNNVRNCQFPSPSIPLLLLPEQKESVLISVPDVFFKNVADAHHDLEVAQLQFKDEKVVDGQQLKDLGVDNKPELMYLPDLSYTNDKIVSQDPAAEKMVAKGSVITLWVGAFS